MPDIQAAPVRVRAFTKPDCVFCSRAKRLLTEAGVTFETSDIHSGQRVADASAYLSGSYKVPQVFIGRYHIGEVDDLARLRDSGRLARLIQAASGELPLAGLSDEELAAGARDFPLSTVIGKSDGTRDTDPRTWPILRMYRQFFGFWPNTFAYLHHWPEAYQLFVYCQNAAAVQAGQRYLGRAAMSAVSYATSSAHGCSYCMTHALAAPGSTGPDIAGLLSAARRGEEGPGNPFGPHELALADLAARATRNAVTAVAWERMRATVTQARQGDGAADARQDALALVVASFGFLNVFNDLTGLEVEGDWAALASASGVPAGRHAAEDANPRNLDHDLPEGGPTLPEVMASYDAAVADLDSYATRELGFVPAWMTAWPAAERRRHCYLYTELMGERDHSRFPAELKHLMARVSAIARDHGYLAAAEGFLAHRAAGGGDRAVRRVAGCYAAATGQGDDGGAFDARELAALRLAWLSAQVPLVTPYRFVQPAVASFDPAELVQLTVACAIAGLTQRFAALARPAIEPEVQRFLDAHRLEADPLVLRYPLPGNRSRAARSR